jgi:hypothetical protein
MSDIFISYSRRDQAFVRALHGRLTAEKREVWVDWEDIPPSAEWLAEIERAIEAADTVVFVISPDSTQSKTCRHECEHAARMGKRLVPVVVRDVDAATAPDAVARLNWLSFVAPDAFDRSYASLISTIETDLMWARAHARLLVRARDWEARGKDQGFLIGGSDLEESERWLAQAADRQPTVTPLQVAYTAASRQRETQRQRSQLRGFYLVSLVYGLLQTGVSYLVVFDEISEEGLIALSPLWVLGIVFGLAGLTIGRNSLKRSVVAAVLAGVLLFLFFITLWGAL